MFFRQLFDESSSTYTYLIADNESGESLLIDPVLSNIDEYISLLNKYSYSLKFSLETHVHADHITASGQLKKHLGCATGVSGDCEAITADIHIKDGDTFKLGHNECISAMSTPGHTKGSMSFLWRDRVFTGDTLLINGCGRTDFQSGSPSELYKSITKRLFTLPDDTLVYPGHDYNGKWVSTIKQERSSNVRIAYRTEEEFISIMNELNLPKPKLLDVAVPANKYFGNAFSHTIKIDENNVSEYKASLEKKNLNKLLSEARRYIKEITVDSASEMIENGEVFLIDVREKDEFEEGSISGAQLISRGVLEFQVDQLVKDVTDGTSILLYCRSGKRSLLAAQSLHNLGYTNVISLAGGYEAWKQKFSS